MNDIPMLAVVLSLAVPLTALVVVLKHPLAAVWHGPLLSRLRAAHWSVRVAALAAFALLTAHGGGKGGGGTQTLDGEAGDVAAGAAVTMPTPDEARTLAAIVAELAAGGRPWLDPARIDELSAALSDDDGTKDGQSAAPLGMVPPVPAWYTHDPTDTDQDFIPDLWEIWTHGNPLVSDSLLDRDGDGLNDLYEFWNQTDPRVADTDGDGFDDLFELTHAGLDPLVRADFTPVEPDDNHNGVIDLWEGSGLLYGFEDTSGDGFDDAYAATLLPPASEANFDVLADVRTTRSAALVWADSEGSAGIVLPATHTGTLVRLRFPFDAETSLRLLPAPEGVDPPAGQLWRARLRLSHLPREGQSVVGTSIVSAEGAISRCGDIRESAVVRFPDAPQGLSQPQADPPPPHPNEGVPANWPERLLRPHRFRVLPEETFFHAVGEVVGPFTVTEPVNADPQTAGWSASLGTMAPTVGPTSSLSVTTLPPHGTPIVVTARIAVDEDEDLDAVATARVWHCQTVPFSLDDCTLNFAPHLGETLDFSVTLPGCPHANEPGWFEAQILRVTTTGWQHVAWVDLDPETLGVQQRRSTSELPHQPAFTWDGIAQVSLPLADHPDVFTGGTQPFHRAMPAILDGEAVPPPFYTLSVRVWDEEQTTILAAEDLRVHVPQVVSVEWTWEARMLLDTPKHFIFSDGEVLQLYDPPEANDVSHEQREHDLVALTQAFFPPDVNVRIARYADLHHLHAVKRVRIEGRTVPVRGRPGTLPSWVYGEAVTTPRNEETFHKPTVYVGSMFASEYERYSEYERRFSKEIVLEDLPPDLTNGAAIIQAVLADASTHEIGHSLGLVHESYLASDGESHNPITDFSKLMNARSDDHRTAWHTPRTWMPVNLQYLRFILPTPEPGVCHE